VFWAGTNRPAAEASMSATPLNNEAIFHAARDIADANRRREYVREACEGDETRIALIEALLAAAATPDSLLDRPAVGLAGNDDTRTGPPVPDGDLPLDFLESSDKPGSIGRLGHYEVQEVVGRGGMGVVLRAFDERLHRVVAIKVMAPQLATSATARKRFTREARAAAAVTHDHVVTIHAVEDGDLLPYIVMQFVAGASLQDRLDRSGPLPLAEILRIGMQTACGLAAAHAQGLVHRDIKPANILLENGVERVKLTDFGLARAADDANLTQSGAVAGTPSFMSPEQAEGKAVDHRSDLFSLGSVLYAMCTGRPPFRAGTSMGVLKRVCDDTPTPVRETNSEIPDWLAAVVEKLHAKDPAARFQTAADVAEVLGRHLAHVQHPSVVPFPVVAKSAEPAPARLDRHRRWAVAAAVLVATLAVLGTTEATGVTNVRATVIRIFTPEGTLVVETDDPTVKVTVEGDGDLVITGAGPQEVRLRAGSYRLRATKDGQPVKLDRDLVTITRGDRAIVRVRMESATPAAVAPKAESGAFVLLAPGVERKFDTLAEAVRFAADGDTIVIRGNGPFVTAPIDCGNTRLAIRAEVGSRPVIRLSADAVQENVPLLASKAALVLEGLELDRASGGKENRLAVQVFGAPLHAANCRLRAPIWSDSTTAQRFHNCEFLSPEYSVGGRLQHGSKYIFENCVHQQARFQLGFEFERGALRDTSIRINRNTFATTHTSLAWVRGGHAPGLPDPQVNAEAVRIDVSESVFDVRNVLGVNYGQGFHDKLGVVGPAEAAATLQRLVLWQGERNLFTAGSTSVAWSTDWEPLPQHGPKTLDEWKRFWNATESGSQQGRIRFQGGNLLAWMELERLKPADFRLRPDSAGYRAGKNGKDLGADVDLVGPGEPYERWKKTPEYQEWLKASGQVRAVAPKAGSGEFVILGGKGVSERKFDTLAEAVHRTSDGDTIEIRGNGPFGIDPIEFKHALTIRAGAGFLPVLKASIEQLQPYASYLHSQDSLRLEGLEIHCSTEVLNLLNASGTLWVSNCRFHRLVGSGKVCIQASLASEIRNCELYSPRGAALVFVCESELQFRVLNCILVGHINFEEFKSSHGAAVRLSGNTLLTPQSVFLDQLHPKILPLAPAPGRIELSLAGNLFNSSSGAFKLIVHSDLKGRLSLDEAEEWVLRRIKLSEERNVYQLVEPYLRSQYFSAPEKQLRGGKSLSGWNTIWGLKGTGSSEGILRFDGGDLLGRAELDATKLTTMDFRLRPDSAGYRAGKDGKDLGADVDLVGPGAPYEKWKKTPEYQEWLKETGQVKK
jgi:hypothetical protein